MHIRNQTAPTSLPKQLLQYLWWTPHIRGRRMWSGNSWVQIRWYGKSGTIESLINTITHNYHPKTLEYDKSILLHKYSSLQAETYKDIVITCIAAQSGYTCMLLCSCQFKRHSHFLRNEHLMLIQEKKKQEKKESKPENKILIQNAVFQLFMNTSQVW